MQHHGTLKDTQGMLRIEAEEGNLKGLNEDRRSRSEGFLQVLERLAPQVGLEPTTLRLTAVRVVLTPAATGCYKLLSFVRFTSSLLFPFCYLYTPNYDRF